MSTIVHGFGTPAAAGARVLIVDDEPFIREILASKLRSLGYRCEVCADGESASSALKSGVYDLLISDLRMPGIGGLVLIEEARRICPDTAVIVVTSVTDLSVAVETLKHGIYDFITKPFVLEHVAIAAARAVEKRSLTLENRRYRLDLEDQIAARRSQLRSALSLLEGTYHSTLVALGTALDSRDAHTGAHSLRVTLYSARLARELGVPEPERREIEQGALLHDIGKIGLPDALLSKRGRLTDEEWEQMRKHPEIGCRILSGIKFLRGAARIVLQHHERFDGSGYPAGLRGEEISLGARLFSVADTLDCVTSDRPFQAPVPFESAFELVANGAGASFDPQVVEAFRAVPLEEWKAVNQAVSAGRHPPGDEPRGGTA